MIHLHSFGRWPFFFLIEPIPQMDAFNTLQDQVSAKKTGHLRNFLPYLPQMLVMANEGAGSTSTLA